MTPAEHAAAVLTWLDRRSLREVEAHLIADAPTLCTHAAAIADAADSMDAAVRDGGLSALFGGLIEPLNDGFTPAGRALYARLFAHIAWRVAGQVAALRERLAAFGIVDEAGLVARHAAVRRGTGVVPASARRIAVLSRVTIGADVLLTTVALQRLRQRYPAAELVVLGDGKLAGLVGGAPGVRVRALSYPRRGPLRDRLGGWLTLTDALAEEAPDLVLAPDSRLDQLGVLPVIADPARYLLWENTQPEAGPPRSLADLLDDWLVTRLDLPAGARVLPRLCFDAATSAARTRLAAALGPRPFVAVKLDHGGNPAKALPRPAELAVLRRLRDAGWRVLLDRGFGPEELANSDALLTALGWRVCDLDDSGAELGRTIDGLAANELAGEDVLRFHGSIAGWAAAVACCRLAFSYDSVGHHLAAALGVPVVVAFTGFSDAAFPVAWQPRGAAAVTVVEVPTAEKADAQQWRRVVAAVPLPG